MCIFVLNLSKCRENRFKPPSSHRTLCLCRENRPQKGGICVANHTTPIDVVILANDGCYALVSVFSSGVCLWRPSVLTHQCLQVGQIHGGLLGVLQRSMVRSCPHVWFERSDTKDRHDVASRWGWVLVVTQNRALTSHLHLFTCCGFIKNKSSNSKTILFSDLLRWHDTKWAVWLHRDVHTHPRRLFF